MNKKLYVKDDADLVDYTKRGEVVDDGTTITVTIAVIRETPGQPAHAERIAYQAKACDVHGSSETTVSFDMPSHVVERFNFRLSMLHARDLSLAAVSLADVVSQRARDFDELGYPLAYGAGKQPNTPMQGLPLDSLPPLTHSDSGEFALDAAAAEAFASEPPAKEDTQATVQEDIRAVERRWLKAQARYSAFCKGSRLGAAMWHELTTADKQRWYNVVMSEEEDRGR